MQRDGGPGGGAGGLGSGGSFTGAAEALEIVGDFAYAYSGEVTVASAGGGANTTLLNFTSGNFLFVGFLNFSNNIDGATAVDLEMSLNGQNVLIMKEDNSATDHPMRYNVIIPAYTQVSVKWGQGSGDNEATALLTGRIYRG